MMSGHNNNLKKKSKGKKQKHKTDDEIYPSMSAHESTNMLKADIQKERGANPGQSSHSSPASKDSPSNFLPKVDELFPAASARVEERVDYWQEDEVQKFMQSNPNQVESSSMSSPINRAHNYLAGTFNVSTDERSSLFSLPDRCSGSRSVFCAVTDFFRGSITAASSGSRSGGGFHYDTTTSPSETETWTMLLPLKRLVLRAITVVLYICDALGIKTALTEKVNFHLMLTSSLFHAFLSSPISVDFFFYPYTLYLYLIVLLLIFSSC